MWPPAPARFSTITGCPMSSHMRFATARVTLSLGPPAGKAAMNRTGLTGYAGAEPGLVVCAVAETQTIAATNSNNPELERHQESATGSFWLMRRRVIPGARAVLLKRAYLRGRR